MKITTILKDIFLALASTLLFGGGIGFLGVWIFDAKISTMLHISVYIFLLMLAMWLFIDYEEMKSRQSIQQAIREEEEKQQRMKEEKLRTVTTPHYTYHPITRTKYSVVITTTRSPHDITIFMYEDYNRALRLMKQINTARIS